MNTSKKKQKEDSKKIQLTEIIVPKGGLNIECRIADLENKLFDPDEEEAKRIPYRAIISPDYSIIAIYNGKGERCSIKELKTLDPKASIFSKSYRKYFIDTYGMPSLAADYTG